MLLWQGQHHGSASLMRTCLRDASPYIWHQHQGALANCMMKLSRSNGIRWHSCLADAPMALPSQRLYLSPGLLGGPLLRKPTDHPAAGLDGSGSAAHFAPRRFVQVGSSLPLCAVAKSLQSLWADQDVKLVWCTHWACIGHCHVMSGQYRSALAIDVKSAGARNAGAGVVAGRRS